MRALRVAQLFDGESFCGAADLMLSERRIAAITAPGDHSIDVDLGDLGDVTALPGLIDAHQHLTWNCSTDPVGWHESSDDADLLAKAKENASRTLAAGVTTVRDLGSRGGVMLGLRGECAADPAAGPTLLVSGPPLTTLGGHCYFLGGECRDIRGLMTEVRRQADLGVDVVKVMATGGNVTPGSLPHESQFGLAELVAIARVAHDAGLPVAAHAHGAQGVADALDAGVDSIEHCSFMTADGIGDEPALVNLLASSGVPIVLTAGNLPGPMPPAIAARLPLMQAHLRGLLDAGVNCIVATDAGVGPPKPHDVLPHAVLQVHDLTGMSIEAILRMCTSHAADVLGLGDHAGRLTAGRPADVLVVAGRLDREPEAILRPVRVLRAGVVVGP